MVLIKKIKEVRVNNTYLRVWHHSIFHGRQYSLKHQNQDHAW